MKKLSFLLPNVFSFNVIKSFVILLATGSTANTLKKSDMDVMTNRDCERAWERNQIMDFHICVNDHDSDSSACMV